MELRQSGPKVLPNVVVGVNSAGEWMLNPQILSSIVPKISHNGLQVTTNYMPLDVPDADKYIPHSL